MQKKNLRSSNPKLLIVEDDKTTVDVLKIYIKDKYDLDWAKDAEEAFKKAKENNYNGFLMDIGLPGNMNGMEVTKNLKEFKDNKTKPFIAITAYAMIGDKEHFFSEGLTHYIVKPFNSEDLMDTIAKALNNEVNK